jgi:hypothetical protein
MPVIDSTPPFVSHGLAPFFRAFLVEDTNEPTAGAEQAAERVFPGDYILDDSSPSNGVFWVRVGAAEYGEVVRLTVEWSGQVVERGPRDVVWTRTGDEVRAFAALFPMHSLNRGAVAAR